MRPTSTPALASTLVQEQAFLAHTPGLSLTSLPYDTLNHVLSFLCRCTLLPALLANTTLYAAGIPHLLDSIRLETFEHTTSLADLLARLPTLGPCVHKLHIGPRDPNTHRDAAALLAKILPTTQALTDLAIDDADDLLRHKPIAAVVEKYGCLTDLALRNEPHAGYAGLAAALLAALPAPLAVRKLELRHLNTSLAALRRFAKLEELAVEGEYALTDALGDARWPALRALDLKDCQFAHRRLARACPRLERLRAFAGGLPYYMKNEPPEDEDGEWDDADADAAWPALVTAEVDLWALVLFLPRLRVPHLRFVTPAGPVASAAALLPLLTQVQPAFLSLVAGRELEHEFWAALAARVEGLRGVDVTFAWDWSWKVEEMLDAVNKMIAALSALPRLNVLRVNVATWPFTAANNAHQFSLPDREMEGAARARLAEATRAGTVDFRWERAGWVQGPVRVLREGGDVVQLAEAEEQTMEAWAEMWKRNPEEFDEKTKWLKA